MSKSLILVTGATGKTGSAVVRQLLDRGYPVRATVRKRDERADDLEALGAEVVVADFHDLRSMRGAMKGVGRVYFVYPPQGASSSRRRRSPPPPRGMPGSGDS